MITLLLSEGFLPVLASIGFDHEGQTLNVNADTAAAGIARLLNASGLLFLTDTAGVLDRHGALIESLRPTEIDAAIETGEIQGGMIAKVRSAALASTSAAIPVTIASWNDPDSLSKLTQGAAIGTRILPCDAQESAKTHDSIETMNTTGVPNA